jgi:hypothetical protein
MRARQIVAGVAAWASVAVLGGACSFLFPVDGFDQGSGGAPPDGGSTGGGAPGTPDGPLDAPPDVSPAPCAGKPDGTPCPDPDPCHAGMCAQGSCVPGASKGDGTVVGGDVAMRCCGGHPTSVTTNSNCGVCGLSCASGQTCKPQGQSPIAYQCSGCAATGGSPSCWSGCCVQTIDMSGVCVPSTCSPTSHCCTTKCPSGTCQWFNGDKNNYCTYEHMNLPGQC